MSVASMVVFSERIRTRARTWWGKPGKWRNRESYRGLLHRLRENHTLRDRSDPDARWRCCDLWQRTLSNKWNAREFVQRFGCRVPALYWWGRRVGRLPINDLPEHFVVRPVFGDSGRGVYVFVGDRDLLHVWPCDRGTLFARVRREHGWMARFPVLVEEFIPAAEGVCRLPLEYRCHTFGARVAAIEVVERARAGVGQYSFYDEAWQRFPDPMYEAIPWVADVPAPACLEQMMAWARALGTAYGTYVRIDFYVTDHSPVFGEFSTLPAWGRGFTAYANRYFGELWERTFPGRS